MPALGAGMDVGRIVAWHVEPGDLVHRGDIVALVETDKANIDVEVFEDGIVEELLVEAGVKVPVGTPLARIAASAPETAPTGATMAAAPELATAAAGSEDAAVPEVATAAAASGDAVPEAATAAAAPEVATAAAAPEVATAASEGGSVKHDLADAAASEPPAATSGALDRSGGTSAAGATPTGGPVDEHPFVTSPLVRRQAAEAGVDLTRLRGTGPAGVITRHDVEAAAADLGRTVAAGVVGRATGPSVLPAAEPLVTATSSSPYARRLAAERGLDVGAIPGTGPGGAVVARDVLEVTAEPVPPQAERAPSQLAERAPSPAPTAEPSKEERAIAMRLAIARAMERANRDIPHYYLGETVDVEASLRWLADRNADRPPTERILPAVLVLKATALALQEYPDFNGYWIDDAFVPGEGIHLGVAINLRRGGLLAPAIRDADQRSLDELMAALRDLVQRTRSAGLRGSELTDPTITVSNLGDTGVETIQGVITPPQVALVGVGRITERPWAVDGMLAVRRTTYLSLAGDHRASDGHRGGRFLGAIATHLTRAETL